MSAAACGCTPRGPSKLAGDEVVVGRVVGQGVAAATLEVGEQRVERAHGGELELDVGGRVMCIQLAPALLASEIVDGRWGEVARTRLAMLFVDVAPGDHVRVRIRGAMVAAGDVLALRVRWSGPTATALAASPGADEPGARAALDRREAEVAAGAVEERRAAAAAATREADRRRTSRMPWARCTRLFAGAAAALAGVAVMVAPGWNGAVPTGGSAAGLWVMAVAFGGAAMIGWSARHDLPLLHDVGERPAATSRQMLTFMQLAVLLVAVPIAVGRSKSGATNPAPLAGLWIACVIPLVAALVGALRLAPTLRRLGLIEQAAPMPVPPPPRTWGVLEGVVVAASPEPVLSATTTRALHSAGSGKGGWMWDELTVESDAARHVHLDAGTWQATVDTTGMTWAAPPVWLPPDDRGAIRAQARVAPGDRVRVLARTGDAGDTTLRAGGPESLFLIAGTPSALMRRALRPPVLLALYVAAVIASSLI